MKNGDLSFYNKKNQAEIDFILNQQIGLEVKTTATKQDWSKLKKRSEALGLQQSFVISKNFSNLPGTISASQF